MQLKTVTLGWFLVCGGLLIFGLQSVSAQGPGQTAADPDPAHTLSEAAPNAADAGHAEGDVGHAAAPGTAAPGSSNPVTFDPDLAIVTAIIFLLLLAVLWKFAWGPIVEALDTREQTVAEQLAEAKRSQEESRRLLAEHEKKLAGAASEVKQLIDQARRDADVQKQQIVESAQAAAAAEQDRAVRAIHAAKQAALHELAQKSVATAVSLAGQIVHRQLNTEDHSQLIGDALQQLSNETN
jgi:F-type H+-transporting ATPase subunit b